MTGIISTAEALRTEAMRLQIYRQAVLAGFYNEAPRNMPYKGYQIMSEDGNYLIFLGGQCLIRMVDIVVAKVWITCRVQNLSLTEALAVVRAETTVSG